MIPWLKAEDGFPPVGRALKEPNGLLAAGADLSVRRLLQAYRGGIFPWFNEDQPILWWSPDPRMVMFPAELKISRSLGKRLRRRDYEVAPTPRSAPSCGRAQHRAMASRHVDHPGDAGGLRSLSSRRICALGGNLDRDELAGGLYGVAVGRAFFGESMFTRATDASKIALAHLARQLERWATASSTAR
jgi:leucyl/phenylalanyl-tRNA--protein transferase